MFLHLPHDHIEQKKKVLSLFKNVEASLRLKERSFLSPIINFNGLVARSCHLEIAAYAPKFIKVLRLSKPSPSFACFSKYVTFSIVSC